MKQKTYPKRTLLLSELGPTYQKKYTMTFLSILLE